MTNADESRTTACVALKKAARAAAQDRRTAAWTAWRQRTPDGAAQGLASHADRLLSAVARLTTEPPRIASAYLPMRTEIDPLALLAALAARGLATALPVVAARDTPLDFRRWRLGDVTVPAGFGTREPAPDAQSVEPDLLLVPLLAFDRHRYRLGYGGGYYDRTLGRLRSRAPDRVVAVGVGFDEQEIDAVPHLDYDERLDGILTPSGLVHFR